MSERSDDTSGDTSGERKEVFVRLIEKTNREESDRGTHGSAPVNAYWGASEQPIAHQSYHELSETPLVERDALAQLKNNLVVLSEMQNRLAFLMREVKYLLKI